MKIKKLISILLILLFIMQIFQNYSVIAATEISSAKILVKDEFGRHLQRWDGDSWLYIFGGINYYVNNGKEYPAYCVEFEKPGADVAGSYTVNISQLLNNVRVWRTITARLAISNCISTRC